MLTVRKLKEAADMEGTRRASGSVTVARLWGVPVRLHWTFLVFLVIIVWANLAAGAGSVVPAALWVVAIFGSVLIHELAHCVVARRRGAVVEDILLIPLGGISRLKAMPETPPDELAVAIVGPLTSFGLAAVAGIAGIALGAHMWPPTLFAGSWFARLAWLNALLGAFNFLPALPMDGGRVLRAALGWHRDRRAATHLAAQIARLLAMVMIAVGFVYDFWLVLIGAFVLIGASAEEQDTERPKRDDTHAHPSDTHPTGDCRERAA